MRERNILDSLIKIDSRLDDIQKTLSPTTIEGPSKLLPQNELEFLLGLNDGEVKVYITLRLLGPGSATSISKFLNMSRCGVTKWTTQLVSRGILKRKKDGQSVIFYLPGQEEIRII